MPADRTTRPLILETLQALAEADGPPGREEPVRRLAARHLDPSMRRVRLSPLGSLYAERASARGSRLMLMACLDEAGFIVSHADRDGIAWLAPSGRIDPDTCTGAAIRFPGGINATLGVIPSGAGKAARPRILADLGADQGGRALQTGTMAVFATPWQAGRTAISGKALDGRLGAAVALDVARRTARSSNTLVVALTPLGQLGHRAARAAALELSPTVAIALGAYPVAQKRPLAGTDVRTGKGPVILLRSEKFVAEPRMVETLRRSAARARVPFQLAVGAEDTAGAAAVQSCLEGIPTAALLVPCQGVGTPQQQIEMRDLEAAADLLATLLSRPLDLG